MKIRDNQHEDPKPVELDPVTGLPLPKLEPGQPEIPTKP
jgi:hypothetical protein